MTPTFPNKTYTLTLNEEQFENAKYALAWMVVNKCVDGSLEQKDLRKLIEVFNTEAIIKP